MADCSFGDLACYGQSLASSAIGNAIDNMAKAVQEAFGKAVASLGTIWVNIGTPNLTGGDAPSIAAGTSAPNSEGITTVLGYVTWVSLAICGIAMIILGMIVASRLRSGQGIAAVGRAGIILGAVILISGASSLVSTILAAGPSGAGGAVAFLQAGLWWYMGALAVLSVIIGGARMAWEQRAEPGRDTLKSLLTLIVVAGAGVVVAGGGVGASSFLPHAARTSAPDRPSAINENGRRTRCMVSLLRWTFTGWLARIGAAPVTCATGCRPESSEPAPA